MCGVLSLSGASPCCPVSVWWPLYVICYFSFIGLSPILTIGKAGVYVCVCVCAYMPVCLLSDALGCKLVVAKDKEETESLA